jgi:aldehyde dehydrogenase (NAD+)/betaine-aldehyde dehydrogenase
VIEVEDAPAPRVSTGEARIYGIPRGYIDGRWVDGEGPMVETVNPATEQVVERFGGLSGGQTELAVRAARGAFDGGAWSRLGPRDRSDLLFRLADLIEANRPALVDLLIDEIGTPYSLANGGQTELPVANLRWFAEAARRGADGGFEQLLPLTGGTYSSASLVVREPIGVVAALTSYNFPLNLAAFKLGGALAAGCSVVLMPSPRAVLSTVALVRLVEETGIPPGAVNLVYGDPGIAERLVAHPAVDVVTFTGSAAVGSRVLSLAAPTLKRVVLELGGKSADIMLPSTDVAALAQRATFGWTVNAGQGCGCTSRTLVPRSQYERYLDAACAFVAGMGCGDPRAKETVVGPLITDAHRRRVEGFIARAADAGADIGTGGRRRLVSHGAFTCNRRSFPGSRTMRRSPRKNCSVRSAWCSPMTAWRRRFRWPTPRPTASTRACGVLPARRSRWRGAFGWAT